MASDSAKPRAGKGDIPKYDAARQSEAGPALITAAKAYNPDADVTADAGKEEKKRKKVRCKWPPWRLLLSLHGRQTQSQRPYSIHTGRLQPHLRGLQESAAYHGYSIGQGQHAVLRVPHKLSELF